MGCHALLQEDLPAQGSDQITSAFLTLAGGFFTTSATWEALLQYYMANCVSRVPQLTLLDLRTNWTYKCALRTELVHMLGTYCEAPQTRGRSCRSIVKEPPPLGGRAQQLISNSVSSSLGFYTSLDVSVILPFSPGSQERPDSEDMRG